MRLPVRHPGRPPRTPVAARRAVALGLLLGLAPFHAAAAGLSAAELRGKQIYFEGTSPGGEDITALVGAALTPVPAQVVPCSGCHGDDGRGRPEGGVLPSDVTWSYLSKPYGHIHRYGREHPAFTEESLARSILDGTDPAGNVMDTAMPRYLLSEVDMADLVAYLKRLEQDRDPGLADERIRVGTVLPLQGQLAPVGQVMRAVLEAHFETVNAGGGLFGRRLELVAVDAGAGPRHQLTTLRELIETRDVFALVSPFTAGIDGEAAALAEQARIPQIGPFTLLPEGGWSLNRHTFYLYAGLREQGQALIEYAAHDLALADPVLAVLAPDGEGHAGIARAIAEQAGAHHWKRVRIEHYPAPGLNTPERVRTLAERKTEVLLFLGGQRALQALLAAAAEAQWHPYLLLPGALAGQAILGQDAAFDGRIFYAFPTLPGDAGGRGAADFNALHARHELPRDHLAAQFSAYSAARILVEGIKRSGRELSRARLVDALEGLHKFSPGVSRPVSYAHNRRIGVLGAHIVGVDLKNRRLAPVGKWIELDALKEP